MRLGRGCLAAFASVVLLAASPAFAEPAPVASGPPAPASPRALELTQRYFAAMRMEATMRATVKAVMPELIDQFSRSNPNMSPAQRAAIVDAAAQSSQTMIVRMMERMAPIFAQSFTEQELQDLVAFYEGPTGRALVAKTPAFAAKMNPAVVQLMPEMMAEMQNRLCAKMSCTAKAPTPRKAS